MKITRYQRRLKKHSSIRKVIFGSSQRPRLSVFRSNRHIIAQIINDERGQTLISLSDLSLKTKTGNLTKKETAAQVGSELAKKALAKGIKKVVFDRGGYKYHGRIKALAEAARKAGLKF